MSYIPIYRWNGGYFGFIFNGNLFDARSKYLGWIDEENKVWRSDGRFLGEIMEENYILKRTIMVDPVPRVPKVPPVPPVTPVPSINRVGRIPMVGWKDSLNDYK